MPERSVEDVLSGVIRLHLGQEEFALNVLVIEKADEWREHLTVAFGDVMTALGEQTNVAGVFAFLGTHTPTMIELIRLYDVEEVLPDEAWIRSHANEPQVLRAFVLVLAACFPFLASALEILANNPGALKVVFEEFGPAVRTSIPDGEPSTTSDAPTAGPSAKSARPSRTSSSRATSRRR